MKPLKNFNKRKETEPKIISFFIYLFLYLLLFLPLLPPISSFFFPFVAPKGFYFLAISEILFFLFLIYTLFSGKFKFEFSPLFLTLSLFLFFSTLSTIFGVDPSRSFWSKSERMTGLLFQFHLFLFFIFLSAFLKKEDFEKIFAFSLFVALLTTFFFFATKEDSMYREGGPLGNSSFLGTYLLFNFFFSLYLIFESKNDFLKIFSFLSIFFIGLALILGSARAAKISIFFGLLLIFFFYLIFNQKNRILKVFAIFALCFILLSGMASFLLLFKEGSFLQKIFIKLATKARIVVWEGSLKTFLERPILGYGPENYEVVFTKNFHPCLFLKECGGEIWFDRAHNIIFDTLISTGILGFISYLLIFLSIFLILLKGFLKKEISFSTFSIFSALFPSYLLQNLTVFDMPASFLMLFLSFGFINNLYASKKRELNLSFGTKIFLFVFLSCLFLISFVKFVFLPLKSNLLVIKTLKIDDPKERLKTYEEILKISPFGRYQFREQFYFNILNKLQQKGKISKEEISFLEAEFEKTTKESPFDFKAKLFLGRLKIFLGKFEEGEKILNEALKLSPRNQQVYWTLAELEAQKNDFDTALKLAEKAVELESRVLQSHLILIEIAKMSGNESLVKEKIERALKINPSWESEINQLRL